MSYYLEVVEKLRQEFNVNSPQWRLRNRGIESIQITNPVAG